jgi:hypothetical protein
MLQAGRLPGRVLDEWIFFNLPNPSSCTMALGSTQPLIEMSTRNLPGGKKAAGAYGWQTCRHLWAECLKMWEPQPLAIVRASTVCTGIILLTFTYDRFHRSYYFASPRFIELFSLSPLFHNFYCIWLGKFFCSSFTQFYKFSQHFLHSVYYFPFI